MMEMEERELLASLRGYLEELRESGMDELPYATPEPVQAAVVPAPGSAAPAIAGTGNPRPRLLLLLGGAPLAAASEELLARIISAMGFEMPQIHLLSFPMPDAGDAEPLRDALLERIASLAPEVVVALGEGAAQVILNRREPIGKLRGRFAEVGGVAVMATLHPDQLVADEGLKRQVWQEMKQVMARLGK